MWQIPFFGQIRIPNFIRISEITKNWILNTIRYWENPNTKYWISKYRIWILLFGPTIRIRNNEYRIVYNFFWKNSTKINRFVSYKTFCSENLWNHSNRNLVWYSNIQILFGIQKNPNTEYQILYGVKKIRIPNTNTAVWSNYSNNIWILNYLSHPVAHPAKLKYIQESVLFVGPWLCKICKSIRFYHGVPGDARSYSTNTVVLDI